MKTNNRIDVLEAARIENQFDTDAVNYTDLSKILMDFFYLFFLGNNDFSKGIEKNVLESIFGTIKESGPDCKEKLWKIYDKGSDKIKYFISLASAHLIDESEFLHSTSEEGYATVSMWLLNPLCFTLLLGGEELCSQHAGFISKHPLMQKYKRLDYLNK